ncbi:MAG: HAD family hydrolase [bacterium]
MKSEAVKAFIFDLDYTLIDSSEGIVYCFNRARKRAGEPEVPADRIKARIGIPIEKTFELYGSKDPLAMRDEFRRLSREGAMADRSFLLPGVRDTIPALATRGFRLAVASTKSHAEIKTILEKLELSPYFEQTAGSDEVESAKPAPDSLVLLLERMRLEPEQAVYVGDHVVDIKAARAAGMPVIAVRGGPVTEQELTKEDPDSILDNVSGILELLAKIR